MIPLEEKELKLLKLMFDEHHKKFWLNAWKVKNWKETQNGIAHFSFMRIGE